MTKLTLNFQKFLFVQHTLNYYAGHMMFIYLLTSNKSSFDIIWEKIETGNPFYANIKIGSIQYIPEDGICVQEMSNALGKSIDFSQIKSTEIYALSDGLALELLEAFKAKLAN